VTTADVLPSAEAADSTADVLPSAEAATRVTIAVWGSTATVAVIDPDALALARAVLVAELAAVDAACSRFRPDSEISLVHAARGRSVPVGPLLATAVSAALDTAALTDGLVDPTVGDAVAALGYDRDFVAIADDAAPSPAPVPAPGWWRVGWDARRRELLVPRGVTLDLGATAKALAADRIAALVADATGGGALVSLGGDLAVAGPVPDGGWRVGVADDHTDPEPGETISITGGGLATSGTVRRRWRRGGRVVHHIVDPRTGDVAAPCWRTATVAAAACLDANTASTAAVVLGADAPAWLVRHGLPARLVSDGGAVTRVGGWPEAS
jgi:FAD:protein FMN transferase